MKLGRDVAVVVWASAVDVVVAEGKSSTRIILLQLWPPTASTASSTSMTWAVVVVVVAAAVVVAGVSAVADTDATADDSPSERAAVQSSRHPVSCKKPAGVVVADVVAKRWKLLSWTVVVVAVVGRGARERVAGWKLETRTPERGSRSRAKGESKQYAVIVVVVVIVVH